MAQANRLRLPKVVADRTGDLRSGAYPWQLLVSGACWLVLGITLIFSRIGAVDPPDEETARQLSSDANGVVLAPAPQSYSWLPYLPWLGVAVLVVLVALMLRQAWARIVLAILGLVGVVALSFAAQWGVFIVLITWIAGSVLALTPPAHRYLVGSAAAPQRAA